MSFQSPLLLGSLLLVPFLVVLYVALMQSRAGRAQPLGAVVEAGRASSRRRPRWRRHLPPAMFLVAISVLLMALARPEVGGFPHREGTVILAFDVSGSMAATDMQPSRLDAEKQAAQAFVKAQPSSIKIGVVAFGNSALVVQEPTTVQADVRAAIDRLTVGGSTSLGDGLVAALGALAGKPIVLPEAALQGDTSAVDVGYFGSAAIVLFSDGENLGGLDPATAAEIASNAGVRVFTVGVGTAAGTTLDVDGYRVATALDEPLLQDVASRTNASYHTAQDSSSLAQIYKTVDLHLTTKRDPMEVTSLAGAVGAVLLLVGGAFSMRWFGRVP